MGCSSFAQFAPVVLKISGGSGPNYIYWFERLNPILAPMIRFFRNSYSTAVAGSEAARVFQISVVYHLTSIFSGSLEQEDR
jgi:hypothetical protein